MINMLPAADIAAVARRAYDRSQRPKCDFYSMMPWFDYQRAFHDDSSQFRIVLKSRQTGFSTSVGGGEAVEDAINDGISTLIVSATKILAKEVVNKAGKIAKLYPDEVDHIGKEKITFKNGAEIIALPCTSFSTEGWTGNVILDEAAKQPNAWDVYQAVAPCATLGHKITVISTPFGAAGFFYEMWQDEDDIFSHHKIHWSRRPDIDAETIDKIKKTMKDPIRARSEYECSFEESGIGYFQRQMMMACHEPGIEAASFRDVLKQPYDGLYWGWDAAKKIDGSVIVVIATHGELFKVVRHWLFKRINYSAQLQFLDTIIPHCSYGLADMTGVGEKLVEDLQATHGGKADGLTFTAPKKATIITDLWVEAQNATLRMDMLKAREGIDETPLDEFLALQQIIPEGKGVVRYDGSTRNTHCDTVWATALALHAAKHGAGREWTVGNIAGIFR